MARDAGRDAVDALTARVEALHVGIEGLSSNAVRAVGEWLSPRAKVALYRMSRTMHAHGGADRRGPSRFNPSLTTFVTETNGRFREIAYYAGVTPDLDQLYLYTHSVANYHVMPLQLYRSRRGNASKWRHWYVQANVNEAAPRVRAHEADIPANLSDDGIDFSDPAKYFTHADSATLTTLVRLLHGAYDLDERLDPVMRGLETDVLCIWFSMTEGDENAPPARQLCIQSNAFRHEHAVDEGEIYVIFTNATDFSDIEFIDIEFYIDRSEGHEYKISLDPRADKITKMTLGGLDGGTVRAVPKFDLIELNRLLVFFCTVLSRDPQTRMPPVALLPTLVRATSTCATFFKDSVAPPGPDST